VHIKAQMGINTKFFYEIPNIFIIKQSLLSYSCIFNHFLIYISQAHQLNFYQIILIGETLKNLCYDFLLKYINNVAKRFND
jgi:hypothetical protein